MIFGSTENQHVVAEIKGCVGFITLSRPSALNALSLPMIRALSSTLLAWREDEKVQALAIRGSNKTGPFGAFSAGGDIRFFHQAVLRGDAELEDFFTEEYHLNHLIHHYPKPYIAFMDGIVMGGGMGISQGASLRIVTERTKMAMPEVRIGLFPDVGGGYFLSRCPGHSGEWLALSGELIEADAAISYSLADVCFEASALSTAWDSLAGLERVDSAVLSAWQSSYTVTPPAHNLPSQTEIDGFFSLPSVSAIVQALEAAPTAWAQVTATKLRQASPLMLHVTLEQVRRARHMSLGDDLRLERNIVRHCFNTRHLQRFGTATETMEGIRALAVDKDHQPKWRPMQIELITADMVQPFFESPWPSQAHPLRDVS